MSAPKKPASKQPAAGQLAPGGPAGDRIITLALVGTAAFVFTAAAAAISPGAFRMVALLVALALFGIGMLLFLAAYARAISQSRAHVSRGRLRQLVNDAVVVDLLQELASGLGQALDPQRAGEGVGEGADVAGRAGRVKACAFHGVSRR